MAVELAIREHFLFAIVGMCLLWSVAWLLGGVALRYAKTVRSLPIDQGMLRVVLGMNLLAWLGVVAGMSGALATDRTVWCVGGLGLAAAWECWLKRRELVRVPMVIGLLSRHPLLVALLTGAGLLTLGPALAYPTGWDELVYHNVLPRRWRADGWPAFYPDLPYSGFPSACEILLWLIAPLESVLAPRLFIWSCWIVGLTLMGRMIRRRVDGLTTVALVLAFAVSPTTLMASANCYVESFLLMNVAALMFVLGTKYQTGLTGRSQETSEFQRASPLLLGVLAGGSAAVKLTGLSVILLPLLWYAGGAVREANSCPTVFPFCRRLSHGGGVRLRSVLSQALVDHGQSVLPLPRGLVQQFLRRARNESLSP